MSIEQVLFYLLGFFTLGFALLVVTLRNIVRSIFLFFITLFTLAGLYIFAMADFVAVTQVVIYVGGILVLMLFAFMLSDKQLLDNLQSKKLNRLSLHHIPGILIALLFLAVLLITINDARVDELAWIHNSAMTNGYIANTDNTIHYIGVKLMTTYLLPFEVISIILMMALIGAAHLARKDQQL